MWPCLRAHSAFHHAPESGVPATRAGRGAGTFTSLFSCGDEGLTEVQLIHDVEEPLLKYTYELMGDGNALRVRILDKPYGDNYGRVRIFVLPGAWGGLGLWGGTESPWACSSQ